MLYSIWNTLLYKPFLNILAVFVSIMPGGDIGLAVLLLTILVKTALLPLSKASMDSQAKINKLAPEVEKIKKSAKSKEEQAQMTFALYKENKTHPLSGCLLVLIQIPIIFALYYVFLKGISFDADMLYSFVKAPVDVNMHFLGIINIAEKSMILAVLAGVTQYFSARSMPKPAPSSGQGGFGESFAKSMQLQMRYIFPVVVVFIAYNISGAVAIYWITNNLFTTAQQLYFKRKSAKKDTVTVLN